MQHRKLGFERASYLVGEPGRRFHDDIDNQLSPGGCQLQFLFFEFPDGLLDALAGVFPNVGAIIQYPVDSCNTESCLKRNLLDQEAMSHWASQA
ncbi:conserved hypothetical protein [Paraburkholderia caribensis]|nr:conserved hypothetical protein [Paraburkholderia caribensis]